MGAKRRKREVSTGFIGGELPNMKYTDDDLTKVHIFMDGLVFMIMIYVYNGKQDFDTQILVENFKHEGLMTRRSADGVSCMGLSLKS